MAVVKGKPQILATGTFKVQGYDPLDGSELWAVDGMQMKCIPTPVVQGDVAYAVSGYGGDCVAIRLDGSRGNVTGTNVVWKRKNRCPGPDRLRYRAGSSLTKLVTHRDGLPLPS